MRRAPTETGTRVPTSSFVSRGVAATATSVDTVVIATLKATSARARYVTKLLAVPPGQHATIQILHESTAELHCCVH